jgi:hypothetical protein
MVGDKKFMEKLTGFDSWILKKRLEFYQKYNPKKLVDELKNL